MAAAGGACAVRAGGWRVGTAGLQVTRSIGDADLKGQGVSAEAEVAEVELSQQDSFLIAATDGLWDRVRWVGGLSGGFCAFLCATMCEVCMLWWLVSPHLAVHCTMSVRRFACKGLAAPLRYCSWWYC